MLFLLMGLPKILFFFGERRLPSPNDAGVILCEWLAERDAKLQHFFHNCKRLVSPASVFYFCEIITSCKSMSMKIHV